MPVLPGLPIYTEKCHLIDQHTYPGISMNSSSCFNDTGDNMSWNTLDGAILERQA